MKRYHVICIPLYFWGLYEIKTKDQLLSFANVLSRMFSFENIKELEETISENISILDSHFVWNSEIYYVREITKFIDKNFIDSLHIEQIFITDYGFEIVSLNSEIFSPNNAIYSKLASEISKFTFKNCFTNGDNNIFEHPAVVTYTKIITCDTADEIEELSKKNELEKVAECFYIDRCTPFFFKGAVWNKISIPDLIITLKPEIMAENMDRFHLAADKFGLYVSLVHAIGKIFTVSESIHGACANLEITSWNLNEVCENFESEFNYIKANFYSSEKDYYKLFREFNESIQYLTLLANPKYTQIIEKEYGDIVPQLDSSLDVLSDDRANEFLQNRHEIISTIMEDKKVFGETLIKFLGNFHYTINSWREINRSKINHNQMMLTILLTMLALIVAIVTVVIQR
ncbi:MAG TPA: hypothetical protein VIO58_08395 [Candidatus Methanoperedens sp.]